MRIAVFVESPPTSVGPFNQSMSTVEALALGPAKLDVVVFTHIDATYRALSGRGMNVVRFAHRGHRLLDRWSATQFGHAVLSRIRRLGAKRLGRHLDALLEDHAIDVAFFNNLESDVVARIGDHPFLISVWDLDQRDYPEFPEAFRDRGFERVTRSHAITLTRALAVIVNSSSMARRLHQLYQVDLHRIVVLPFLPSSAVTRHKAGRATATAESVSIKYDLPPRFAFFPAYLTHHKNGLYLLEALVDLERRHNIALDAVFCGSGEEDALKLLNRQAKALGLEDRVRLLGLLPDGDVPALYEAALAAVVPSYFGPINLPPLEAMVLGCPVICSDFEACHEQMEDAALYCDLKNPSTLADHLAALNGDSQLRDRLGQASGRLAAKLAEVDYSTRLAQVLNDFDYMRRRWSWPPESDLAGQRYR